MSTEGRNVVRTQIFEGIIRRGEKELEHFQQLIKNAPEANYDFLSKCIQDNANTEFGKRFGFDAIHSYEDFVSHVPVCDFSVFEPYVQQTADYGKNGLICREPIVCFYFTSGTTSRPKWIPCTRKSLDTQNRYMVSATFGTIAREMGNIWADGPSLLIGEAASERTKAGLPVTQISCRTIENQRKVAAFIFTSPMEVTIPTTKMDSIALHVRFALENRRIADCQSSYAVYPLEFMHYLENHWEELADQLEYGIIGRDVRIEPKVRTELEKRLIPNCARARELREIMKSARGEPLMPLLWPNLKIIVTGTGADYGIYENHLRKYTGDIRFYHRGYTASEGIFSIPESVDCRDSVLLPDSVFYEFRLKDGRIVPMDRLTVGTVCTMLVTNGAGLYRYPIGDLLEITGFSGTCPKIKLLGRENKTLNLTSEKLHMPLVNEVVEQACKTVGSSLVNYTVYADRGASPLPRYIFYIEMSGEPDLERFHSCLTDGLRGISDELAQKMDGGKIGLPVVCRIRPGTWDTFMDSRREQASLKGGQVKPVCLLSSPNDAAYFEAYTVEKVPGSETFY